MIGRELLSRLETVPMIAELFQMSIGGRDNLTLKEHTLAVLHAYETYFEGRTFQCIPNEQFKILLCVHDLGKPLVVREGRLQEQHSTTIEVLKNVWGHVGYPIEWLHPIVCIIDGDPVGARLNSKNGISISESLGMLECMQACLNVSRYSVWEVILTYYQCDVLGYPSLQKKVFRMGDDGRPIYSALRNRFLFSDIDEASRFDELETAWNGNSS